MTHARHWAGEATEDWRALTAPLNIALDFVVRAPPGHFLHVMAACLAPERLGQWRLCCVLHFDGQAAFTLHLRRGIAEVASGAAPRPDFVLRSTLRGFLSGFLGQESWSLLLAECRLVNEASGSEALDFLALFDDWTTEPR